MTTKEQVLDLLKNNGSDFLSGQEIADKLYITRAAVWKAIKALQKEGFEIEAVTNRGYRLLVDKYVPASNEIWALFKAHPSFEKIASVKEPDFVISLDSVDSTNIFARNRAEIKPLEEGLILAGNQTGGRGRRGRSFYSPDNTGLYLSFLLFPKSDFKEASRLTCLTAVAICRAIKNVTGIDVDIKWVNDIFYKGKKVGGILTEAITSLEDGMLSHVIIGIGINLYEPYEGFPQELKKIAGGILNGQISREVKTKLISEIMVQFYLSYYFPDEYPYVEEYKERSMLIGNYVKIISYGEATSASKGYAYVTGIDDSCHLLIRYDDGSSDVLSTGEVSVVKY